MFKPIARLSSWEGRTDATRRAKIVRLSCSRRLASANSCQYVAMSAAIIRGALARLGLQATVVPEITNLPQCTSNRIFSVIIRFNHLSRHIPSEAAMRFNGVNSERISLRRALVGMLATLQIRYTRPAHEAHTAVIGKICLRARYHLTAWEDHEQGARDARDVWEGGLPTRCRFIS
jgi:hypothetical protein